MVEIVNSLLSRPGSPRWAAIAAAAATSLALRLVGVPRGSRSPLRRLSCDQLGQAGQGPARTHPLRSATAAHRQNCGQRGFGAATLFSATLAGVHLVSRLEWGLYDRLEIAAGTDTLELGETLQRCEEFCLRPRHVHQARHPRGLGNREVTRVRRTKRARLCRRRKRPVGRRWAGRRAAGVMTARRESRPDPAERVDRSVDGLGSSMTLVRALF